MTVKAINKKIVQRMAVLLFLMQNGIAITENDSKRIVEFKTDIQYKSGKLELCNSPLLK